MECDGGGRRGGGAPAQRLWREFSLLDRNEWQVRGLLLRVGLWILGLRNP